MSGVNTLIDMGFPENRAHKAWSVMGHRGVQAAMDWLLDHMEDEDIDDPLPASDVTMPDAADNETPAANSPQENAESQISREERTRLLQEKINQKRQENEELEKQRQRESEIRRRKEGQDLSKIKAEMEQKEMQKLVEERKREKRDDRLARQRVKDQIAQDRADKKAREAAAKQTTPKKTIVADAVPPELCTSKYSEAKLQIRLMDGSKLNHTFSANDQLSAVRLYVDMNRTDAPGGESFDLMTAFPKKLFTRDEYDVPLHLLGLTPSAVVMVTKPHDAPSRHDSIPMASGDERADN